MKRTTYIIFGMLLAGLVMVIGCVFYSSMQVIDWNDALMNIEGETKTIQLPECKAVQLVAERDVIRIKEDGKTKEIRMATFDNLPLNICQASTEKGTLTYASDMDKYMTLNTSGDTLLIVFNFSKDKLEKKYQDMLLLNIGSKEMTLALPTGVQCVVSNLENQKTTFKDFDRDTLSFSMKDVNIENCRFRALYVRKGNLNFKSGEVGNLHLHLDGIRSWNVDIDSFRIDTEYLYARGNQNCTLDKGECRQVVWMPQSESASLNIKLKEAARVVVE